MSLLATLRIKKQNREVATLTVATDATHEWANAPTVARVATATVASREKPEAVNDGELTVSDPDRWCWPTSPAMNSGEIDLFLKRQARFTELGVNLEDAERLADKLVRRDREGDDRRLCLECAHLQGFGRWRCGNWQAADVARDGLALDLVQRLQRCGGFYAAQVRQGSNDGKH
jgi:hypothetical protein